MPNSFLIAYEWSYQLITKSAGENKIEILVIQYHLIFEIYLHSESSPAAGRPLKISCDFF